MTWILGLPAVLALVTYVVLLIHPIPLPFISTPVRNLVVASLPPGSELELGDMALAIEGFAWPVIQFAPVTYKDNVSGAKVHMDALEVGFSPVRALIGQPGASITMVGPHIQVNQDIFGPRLSNFDIVPDPAGGPSTVRVLEGTSGFPDVGFKQGGIEIGGPDGTKVRSDNDWLIYNLEAAQLGVAGIIEQAEMGRFSRLIVKHATLEMNDALYSTLRTFNDISFDIAPSPDGKVAQGLFSAEYGGAVMKGVLERVIDDTGVARLKASINNFNLAAFVPSADGTGAGPALHGTAAISIDVGFAKDTGKIIDGTFHVDLTGMDIVIGPDAFPIATSVIAIDWQPHEGIFTMPEAAMTIGQSSGKLQGVFVLGLDDLYGPTVGISVTGTDVMIRPNDMSAPETGFDTVTFKGWAAPLYGAVGIDQAIMSKPGARIESRGRIDMLRRGMGFDMSVAGQGITADDLKRVWPYFVAKDARDWFVKNIPSGVVDTATMKYSFPVGSISTTGEPMPIPQNGIFIEMVASDVKLQLVDKLAPIKVDGKTRLQVHDADFTVAGDGARIDTDKGPVGIANAALVMSQDSPDQRIVEISGSLSGGIPAVLAAVEQIQPGALKSQELPIDPAKIGGTLSVGMLITTLLDAKGAVKSNEYSINGSVQDFGSTEPIQAHTIANGQLSFLATQDGFHVGGQADIDGMSADVIIAGDMKGGAPDMSLSSTIAVADFAKLGFDASKFASGEVSFVASPKPDGSIDMAVDLKNAALDIKDLGITKPGGEPGSLKATIKQTGNVSEITGIDLGFGEVKLKGSMEFDAKKGLQSAEFSNFALTDGDATQLSLTPIKDGFQLRIRGDQFDLRPILKRFFDLNATTGGGGTDTKAANTTPVPAFTQTIAVDAELKRAIGFYKAVASNVSASVVLKGEELRKLSLQAQLGAGRSISVTTNPTDAGRTLLVAFNDMGSLLRLIGVYAQVEGGEGSLVIQQNTADKVDVGEFTIKNFAIVDEKNVAEILGTHSESKKLIAKENKLAFRSAKLDFIRRSDRIQITEGLLSGDSLGGTVRGFVYTNTKKLDLTGTYVPIFGVNNAFAKLFGPLGGRNSEGLFGISFAVTGPLAAPVFKVNPLSALMPGAFRSLFEYRAKEQPRAE
ncbi:MAG: hypothetical protein ABL866_08080 [Devosia sp.]